MRNASGSLVLASLATLATTPWSPLPLAAQTAAPSATVPATAGLAFGRPATHAEIAGWDTDVTPDGAGLPPGRGTAATGAMLYAAQCASCHGVAGGGTKIPGRGTIPRLVGGRGSLASEKPVKTVGSYWPYATIAFDYIRRAMPFTHPGTLSNDDVYALTAFLLAKNGIIPPGEIIDATTLSKVRMPNANGFFPSDEIPKPR